MIRYRDLIYLLRSGVEQLQSMNIIAVFAMSVANAVLGLAMTSILARVLGVESYGEYSFLLSMLAMLAIPLSYGLRQTVLRETAYASARGTTYPRTIWVWACQLALMVSIPFALVGLGWAGYHGSFSGPSSIPVWFGLLLICTPLVHVAIGALQGLEDVIRSQAPEYIIRPTVVLVLVAAVALLAPPGTLQTSSALAIYALATLTAGAYGFGRLYANRPIFPEVEESSTKIDRRVLLRTMAGFSAISIVQVSNDNIDILMLGLLDDPGAVGRYRVAVAVSTIVSLAIIAINTVIAPRIAKLYASGKMQELQRLVTFSTRITLTISFVAFLGLLLFGDWFIWIIFGPEYSGAVIPLLILSGGRCILSGLGPMTTILSQTGNEKFMLAGLALAVLINACLNLVLIPHYSSIGASVAAASALTAFGIIITISVKVTTGLSANPFLRPSGPNDV